MGVKKKFMKPYDLGNFSNKIASDLSVQNLIKRKRERGK